MPWKFSKHYTREEARELLPKVSGWLRQLQALREELARNELRSSNLMRGGNDTGGETVNAWLKSLSTFRAALHEFTCREIQVKDLDRGLVDFPTIMGSKEVFLCWEQGEDDIEFWHDLDAGYAGREHL